MPEMTGALVVERAAALDVPHAAALSSRALTRPLRAAAELTVVTLDGDAMVLGAFQRSSEVMQRADHAPPAVLVRRGSGGPALRAGAGVVWMQLALARPSALVACDAPSLVNRYVRPLLRALTRKAAISHYFGRDWVATAHRPSAWVGFAHDAASGRSLVEALVAVRSPFWSDERASFLGKVPWTLSEAAGKSVEDATIVQALIDAYREAYAPSLETVDDVRRDEPLEDRVFVATDEPSWTAYRDEAIGRIHAGRDRTGTVRLGGEFMASGDAVRALEDAVARIGASPSREQIGHAVNATLAAPGAVVYGVRDLGTIRDVLFDAYTTKST